MSKLNLYL